jgi:NADH dehydrogenase
LTQRSADPKARVDARNLIAPSLIESTDPGGGLSGVTQSTQLPHVVIVGGGFGGLNAADALAKAPVRITLIDRRNYHLFRPLLYQVAAGLLSADEIASPLRSVLSGHENIDVLMDEVVGVDTASHVVKLKEGEVAYDYLILATGISNNYFGHNDWQKYAPSLQALDDADLIRGRIFSAFETAERLAALGEASPETIQALLTFVLVGGGTVGVEMASTMAEMVRLSLTDDFRHIDLTKTQIHLCEAAPRLLSEYPESLSAAAQRHLQKLGVKVHTSTHVDEVDSTGVVASGKHYASRTVLWSAGVLPSPAARWLGAPADEHGRLLVEPDFSVPGHPNIFAMGDTAKVVAPSRNLLGFPRAKPMTLPGVAQPAIQAGQYVAKVIGNRVKGQPAPKPFWYWDKGELAIIGRMSAVADLGFVRFSGFSAWLVWVGVHLYFLIGFANRIFVMLQWAITFLTKRRQVRILPDSQEQA